MSQDRNSAFATDERAVAPLIGFILLFGIGVVAFASYQAFVVPQQNANVEFNHNQDVQGDLVNVRNSVANVQRTGTVQSTRVSLGVNYPSRLVALNPPPVSGSLRTAQPDDNITIQNSELVDEEFVDFDGETVEEETVRERLLNEEHDTRFLIYQPQYNEFQNAPTTIYEHSLLYNQFDNVDLGVTDQRLIEGNTINLILVQGDFSRSQTRAVSVDPRRLSGPTQNVRIEDGDDPIEVTFPTRTLTQADDNEVWEDVLEEEVVSDYTRDPNDETITLTLEEGQYTLRAATIGFSGDSPTDEFNIARAIDDPSAPGPGPGPDFGGVSKLELTGGGQLNNFDVTYEVDPDEVARLKFESVNVDNEDKVGEDEIVIEDEGASGDGVRIDGPGGGPDEVDMTIQVISQDDTVTEEFVRTLDDPDKEYIFV